MDILIEELNGSLWVAALDKNRLESVEVDPSSEEVRWNSIYWARVARIDAGLDAAFVNLDGENIGILYNADVRTKTKGGWKKGGDVAIGKVLKPGQMIAVQAKSGFLPKKPDQHSRAEDKNPRVSMNIVLPGRYLIHAPMEDESRVSQRIHDKKLRAQLLAMIESMDGCDACILRLAAAGTQTDILVRESQILHQMWQDLQAYFTGDEAALLMLGPGAIQRTLSDNAARSIGRIEMTTMDHYTQAEEWCDIFAPDLTPRLQPVEIPNADQGFALFEFHDIVGRIESLLQPYEVLDNGATVIIQETAACVAIDVNSSADTRGKLAINLDAAEAVARNLRVRNLGGAIIVDFLKMHDKDDERTLIRALENALNLDPCTVQLHGFSKLGMMELTRQRRTPPLRERFDAVMAE